MAATYQNEEIENRSPLGTTIISIFYNMKQKAGT
jgi:hypothetical protein